MQLNVLLIFNFLLQYNIQSNTIFLTQNDLTHFVLNAENDLK